jgi:hypothetical protein
MTPDDFRAAADEIEANRGRFTSVDGVVHYLRDQAEMLDVWPAALAGDRDACDRVLELISERCAAL